MAGENQQGASPSQKPSSGFRAPVPNPMKNEARAIPGANPASRPGGATGKYAPIGAKGVTPKTPVPPSRPNTGPAKTSQNPQGASGSTFKPATTANVPLPRPRTGPPPGISGRLSSVGATVSTPGAFPRSAQWCCSTCKKALGPQCVVLGTGIILDGNLICVDCVKGNKRRDLSPVVTTKSLIIFAAGTAVVLGIAGIFFPGQAFLVALLLGIAILLTGLIGFTLSSRARLSAIAAGLLVLSGSVWGLIVVSSRAEARATRSEVSAHADEIQKLLDQNCIFEAELRVSSIEQTLKGSYQGTLSPTAQKAITDLKGLCDTWLKTNFGELSDPEKQLLLELFREFGSVTPKTQTRRLKSIKISDKTNVALAVAMDTVSDKDVAPTRKDKMQMQTLDMSDPVEAEAARYFQIVLKKYPLAESVELKILSTDSGAKELFNKTLDRGAIVQMRQGVPHGEPGGRMKP